MKTKLKCPHCPRSFTGDSKDRFGGGRLKANLSNHIKGSHPEHYVPKVRKATHTLDGSLIIPSLDTPAKRPYTRKPKPQIGVNYCPACGTNLNAIRVAMSL